MPGQCQGHYRRFPVVFCKSVCTVYDNTFVLSLLKVFLLLLLFLTLVASFRYLSHFAHMGYWPKDNGEDMRHLVNIDITLKYG